MSQNGESEALGLRWRGREGSLVDADSPPDARTQLERDGILSYGNDSENMLLHGDNLAALKLLSLIHI